MNILILTRSFGIGGVSIVSSILANKFKQEGHSVTIWAFFESDTSSSDRLIEGISLIYSHGFKLCKENTENLRKVLKEHHIDIIINQWGLPYIPIITARKASKGLNVKIISVYHNAPASNGKIQSVEMILSRCDNPMAKMALNCKKWFWTLITSMSMRYVYNKSDLYLVLSESFIEEFKRFTHLRQTKHLKVQTNPITINVSGFVYSQAAKEKEIIFVGRLDEIQKRISRIISTWNHLEKRFPDWRLTIIGDGPDRQYLEDMVRTLGLERVNFDGFQSPLEYYKRSSLLMLTSDFEGFGLVVTEAMSFGVVSVVYNSYAAAGDLIDDGKNGVLLPFHKEGYDAEEAAIVMSKLMTDDVHRNELAEAALVKSQKFSLDRIYNEWMEKIENL